MSQQPRKRRNLQENSWPNSNIKMKEDLFTNLPTEMVIDILSRLPIQSIIMCKIVCKLWRELVDSVEFAKSHLPKAAPHLVVFLGKDRSIPYKMFEFVDEHRSSHRCKIVSNLSIPRPGPILGSVNGLLFWCNEDEHSHDIFVCNPITREYFNLPRPPPPKFRLYNDITGVGVCRKSGQYKIVRIFYNLTQCEFQLHTLGTGLWRSLSAGTQHKYSSASAGAFLNGNLHWLTYDDERPVRCFDLETEVFTSFSSPRGLQGPFEKTLSVVGDRLCLCDSGNCATEIWFMNEYGDEKSWTKEFIINKDCCIRDRVLKGWLFPIKVFISDILIAKFNGKVFCYSKTTDAIHNTSIPECDPSTSHFFHTSPVIYTPTFVPLRSLLMVTENINPQIWSKDVHDLIPYLPSEIILNILSRIPVRTVMRCKCVCKAWCDLLDTPEFVQSHLSKSVPGLAVYLSGEKSKPYRIVEFVDEHRLNTVFSFDLPFISGYNIVHSSANGLLYVCKRYGNFRDLSFVCNPITREYITIPSPLEASSEYAIHGFGVSKMSGQYKVVRIRFDVFDGCHDCQVYTVGSGSWRRIEFDYQLQYTTVGAFVNGNLHWLAYKRSSPLICCLDLETERFSTFSPPPGDGYKYRILCVLGDYLCVCDTFFRNQWLVRGIDIWLMKEYGDDKSWIKVFHFDTGYGCGSHCPIKLFKGGDFLVEYERNTLLYYSKKHGRETFRQVDLFNGDSSCATIYAPSFVPLKTFAMENVSSF